MFYFISLILTIIIELIIIFLLGFTNKKLLLWVVIGNIITNPLLNYIVQRKNYGFNEILVLELFVVIIEAIILRFFVKEKNLPYFRLSFTINASSFLIGLYLPWDLIEKLYL